MATGAGSGFRRRPLVAGLAACVLVAGIAGCRAGVTRGSILYADALEQLAAGDSAAAVTLLEQARFASPRDARIHYELGRLLARRSDIVARAHGETALREAARLDPSRGAYAAALGELLYSQGFGHESTATLRRAVQLDPTLGRAWFYLGLNLQNEFLEEPGSATLRDSVLLCFDNAIDSDPGNDAARWRLAYLLMLRGQPERARPIARAGFAGRPCPGRFGLLLCTIQSRSGRPLAAASILDSTLACLSPAQRDSLLDPARLLELDRLPPCFPCSAAQLDSFRTRFWWGLDPTPTTLMNERLIEHVVRVVDADFFFGVPRLRLAGRNSDRGGIWIRYGGPDAMWRDIELNERTWRWLYHDLAGEAVEFGFADVYLNSNYLRLKRGASSDFAQPETQDRVREQTRVDFGPPPPGWRYAMRRVRGTDGGIAIEVAFEFECQDDLDSVRVEAAAWRGPGQRTAWRSAGLPRSDLWLLADGHAIGRLRFEVRPQDEVEIGLQATGWEPGARLGMRQAHRAWTGFGRDTLLVPAYDPHAAGMSDLVLAHVLKSGGGGAFDWGDGTIVVPRTDNEIRGGKLQLYFEVYPGDDWLSTGRPLSVSYRVSRLPSRRWSFRDQFDTSARARSERRTSVESTFRMQARQATERQQLTIDVHSLEPGDYLLSVELQVELGWNPVRRTVQFTIPKPRRPTP